MVPSSILQEHHAVNVFIDEPAASLVQDQADKAVSDLRWKMGAALLGLYVRIFRPKLIIAVDLGGTNVRAALLKENGEVFADYILGTDMLKAKTRASRGSNAIMSQVMTVIAPYIKIAGIDNVKIVMGAPDVSDYEKGYIEASANLEVKDFYLKDILQTNIEEEFDRRAFLF